MERKPMLTAQEVAKRLNCSTDQVRTWAAAGKMGAVRIGGTRWRFTEEGVQAFIDEGKVQAAKQE